jgi:hypothetical protein
MFVQVACNQCGKAFQVPDDQAGRPAACPWCKAVVPALPVAGPVPPPAPLSLDDAPPVARPAVRFSYRTAAAVLAVVVAVFGLTLLSLGYRSGRVPDSAWRWYTPPDESFTVLLPGEPAAEPLNPIPNLRGGGGEAFAVPRGWYSGVSAWAGWRDVDPGFATAAGQDKDGVLIASALNAEVDYRKTQSGGKEKSRATVRYGDYHGTEVVLDTDRGRLVERVILVPGQPRPRLYFMGVEAKNLAPDGPVVQKMFNSFRLGK